MPARHVRGNPRSLVLDIPPQASCTATGMPVPRRPNCANLSQRRDTRAIGANFPRLLLNILEFFFGYPFQKPQVVPQIDKLKTFLEAPGCTSRVWHGETAWLARPPTAGEKTLQSRFVVRMPCFHPHGESQIVGAQESDIHPFDAGDRLAVVHSLKILDLRDTKNLVVGLAAVVGRNGHAAASPR